MSILMRGLYNLTPLQKGGVVTIGNFDGVHKGHRALIERVTQRSKALHVPNVLITFEPQPLEYFDFAKVPRLTRWREKFCVLQSTGIENILLLRFNHELANLSADEFIEKILVNGLAAEHVIVGDDFRFGHQRTGNFAFLEKKGLQSGFTVEAMESLLFEGERVSSTRIRQALSAGNHQLANVLLGRPYSMMGRVVHGDKLGRELGFPTANIYLHRAATPVQGIYAVKMHKIDEYPLEGVANVGTRPTVGGTRTLLEVHLFNFDRDIYGQQVEVEFCKKLRDEERYADLEQLKMAIANDVKEGRLYFKEKQ